MKSGIVKRIVGLSLVSILAFALAACGNSGSTKTTAEEVTTEEAAKETTGDETAGSTKIRVAFFQTSVYDSAFYIAYQKGLFEEKGLDVEIINFADGPAVNEAFLADEVDIVNGIGDQPAVISWTNGVDTQLFAATSEVTGAVLLTNDLELSGVEGLEGKKIGVGIGTNKHKALLEILGDAGLSQDDVELVNIDGDDSGIAALSRGEVDAYMFKRPSAEEEVVNAGQGKVLADLSAHPSYSWLVARTSWVNENETAFQAFVDALYEAQLWFEDNEEEGYQLIAELSGLDADTVKGYLSGSLADLSLNDEEIQSIHNTYNFLVEQGSITNEISSDELDVHLNASYIENARATVGK